jgi:molybdopterin-guanine dinucleotide biosynthesis protein
VAVVVVGGNSRSVGKTSVVAGLIARLPEFRWTAFKITQYGHGFCTADGRPCQCQTSDSCVAVSAELDRRSGTDTSRFLAAGAARSIWVRTRIGMLAEAMPKISKEIEASENAILESNSILEFFRPDLYLTVLDPGVADFKDSARRFLSNADALLISSLGSADQPGNSAVDDKPLFQIPPPDYMTDQLVAFVRARLTEKRALAAIPQT